MSSQNIYDDIYIIRYLLKVHLFEYFFKNPIHWKPINREDVKHHDLKNCDIEIVQNDIDFIPFRADMKVLVL